jgi:hypothetical protein
MIDDEEYKRRVLTALEQPRKNKLIAFLNSGLFLWFLTLCVVSIGGAFLTSYQQCERNAEDAIEKNTKIERELFQRELRIREIIMTAQTLAEIKEQLKQQNSFYPEFSGFPTELLGETRAAFLNRVKDLKLPRIIERQELTSLYPVAFGQIPDNITEKNIDLLREYAQKFLAEARPIPLPGYELSPYRPNCGPKTLWQRFFSDPSTAIVRAYEGKPELPQVFA